MTIGNRETHIADRFGRHLIPAVAGLCGTATANTAVTITLTPGTDKRIVIYGLEWSYDGTPTGGRVTVACNATNRRDYRVTRGGPGFMHYGTPLIFDINQAVTVTIAAGGAGVIGSIMVNSDEE